MSNILSISAVRSKLPTLVDRVNKYMDRVVITVSGKPKAVILSQEELESLEETAEIFAIPGAREGIKRGYEQAKKGQIISLSELKKKYKL